MKRKVSSLISVILLFSIFSAISSAMSSLESGTAVVGKKSPGFSLKNTRGEEVDVFSFIGKKPIVFFFWTTWCPHCRRQINSLEQEAKNIKGAGAEIILVDVDESNAQVDGFLRSINSPFESLLDPDARIAGEYLVIGVPTFVIVGADGIIKFHDNLLPGDYQKQDASFHHPPCRT